MSTDLGDDELFGDDGKADDVSGDVIARPVFTDPGGSAAQRTRARADALTTYARQLLRYEQQNANYTFGRRNITADGALATQYDVQVDGTSCWTYQSGYDLDDIDTAVSNVEQTVSFVRGIYEDLNGQPQRWFDTVVLCPNDVAGGDLVLKGKTLYVGVDWTWSFGWYAKDRNAQDIRNDWTAGTHLDYEASQVKQYWQIALNPVGVPRLLLRDTVRDVAGALGQWLRARQSMPGTQLRGALRSAITTNSIADYRRPANVREDGSLGPTLREEALARIETMSEAELQAFTQEWMGFVNDPLNAERMSHSVVAAHEAVARGSFDLTLVQEAWVTLGNFKSIHTNVSFYLPRGGRFARYVSMEKVQHNLRVEQRSTIFAGYFIDDIQTTVAISADLGVETAGLEQAFDTFEIR